MAATQGACVRNRLFRRVISMRPLSALPIMILSSAWMCLAQEPLDTPDDPWLPDPMGIITSDIEGADLPENFSLSEPHTVDDTIKGEMHCYVLRIGDHILGSIASAMKAGDGLVFQKCYYAEECMYGDYCYYIRNGRECLHGWVGDWFVATQGDEAARDLEGLGFFSNPVPCESRLAYWRLKDLPEHETGSEYYAYVADIDSGEVLTKELVGQARIGTDNAYHLAVPRWRPDCSEVLFHDGRHFEPLRITFPAP